MVKLEDKSKTYDTIFLGCRDFRHVIRELWNGLTKAPNIDCLVNFIECLVL